jgi:hypothetical protein
MSSYRRYPPPPPPPSTPPSLPLDRGPRPPPPVETPFTKLHCAIEDAVTDDDNILVRIAYPEEKLVFWTFLHSQKSEIERVVAHHLHLDVTACQMEYVNTWISGSFNVCIPVCIDKLPGTRVLVRIPLPYKIGEASHAGNVDEKLRCEAALYMWIQENSPEIPIPKLFGCGFVDGQTVCLTFRISLWLIGELT